jgi:hypothetical protein
MVILGAAGRQPDQPTAWLRIAATNALVKTAA